MKKIAKEDIQKTYRCFINKYDYDFINNVQSILDYLNWNSSIKFTKKVKIKKLNLTQYLPLSLSHK